MKVAIYNPYLDTLGGGERYTFSFARALAEMGYEVDLAWKNKNILNKLSKRFGMKLAQNINIVKDVKRGEGYDICFWVSDGSIPTLRAKRNFLHFQVPFIDVNGKSLLNKMKLFRVEKIICNSNFTKRVIDEEYGVKSSVIYPAVDVETFKPKRKEKLIIYVGRFSSLKQNKGQLQLIKAFKRLVADKEYKDWKLILAGGVEVGVGNFIDTLKNKANNYNVEIIQSPDKEVLVDLCGRSTFFWSAAGFGINVQKQPQKVEHFGITLVEAMSAGCVPVVYNAGGYKEIVKNTKNGYLWDSIEELVSSTKRISENTLSRKKISKNAQINSKIYSYEVFKKQLEEII